MLRGPEPFFLLYRRPRSLACDGGDCMTPTKRVAPVGGPRPGAAVPRGDQSMPT